MRYVLAAVIASLALGRAWAADAPANLTVELKNSAGASAGSATLTAAPNGVLAHIEAKGLTPGWHGVHFHETGDCSKPGFTSAGAHIHSQASVVHGLLNPDGNDSGDLPNLYAGADGSATADVFSTYVSFGGTAARPGLLDKDGSALVIHANPDDYKTQPIGGAGARVACGVIGAP